MTDIIIPLWESWLKIPALISVLIFCIYSFFTLPNKHSSAETSSQKVSRERLKKIVKFFLVFLLIWGSINLYGSFKTMVEISKLDDKSLYTQLFIDEILLWVIMFFISILLMLSLKISIDKLKQKY